MHGRRALRRTGPRRALQPRRHVRADASPRMGARGGALRAAADRASPRQCAGHVENGAASPGTRRARWRQRALEFSAASTPRAHLAQVGHGAPGPPAPARAAARGRAPPHAAAAAAADGILRSAPCTHHRVYRALCASSSCLLQRLRARGSGALPSPSAFPRGRPRTRCTRRQLGGARHGPAYTARCTHKSRDPAAQPRAAARRRPPPAPPAPPAAAPPTARQAPASRRRPAAAAARAAAPPAAAVARRAAAAAAPLLTRRRPPARRDGQGWRRKAGARLRRAGAPPRAAPARDPGRALVEQPRSARGGGAEQADFGGCPYGDDQGWAYSVCRRRTDRHPSSAGPGRRLDNEIQRARRRDLQQREMVEVVGGHRGTSPCLTFVNWLNLRHSLSQQRHEESL